MSPYDHPRPATAPTITPAHAPVHARPVLKWAGGKRKLLPALVKHLPDYRAYHEPFVGSAALFFELQNGNRWLRAHLSDVNQALMDVYVGLRDHVEMVISYLHEHRYDERHYYAVRAQSTAHMSLPERAARMIYLNKTCFNGLYRENRAGQFNVPFGRHVNPTICDEANLRAASAALQGVRLVSHHFEKILESAQSGDLVYFDPPYYPVSATARFTSYTSGGFSEHDQRHLRDIYRELDARGVYVILSNSDTTFIRDLYADWQIETVYAARAINSRATARGKVAEVIVRNFGVDSV
ncbi:MAG: DNA adenine methylase [Chloroflexota bacterium]|nr:DNA adenine methylase [Chloroflexota bacterium]